MDIKSAFLDRNLENNFHERDSQRSWTSDHGVFTKIINGKLFVIVVDVDNFLLFLPNIEAGISVIVNCWGRIHCRVDSCQGNSLASIFI